MDFEQLLDAFLETRDRPRCGACEAPAAKGAVFCTACGVRLTFPCPACEHPCRNADEHCPACGAELAAEAVAKSVGKFEAEEQLRLSDPLRAFDELFKLGEGHTTRYRASRQGERRFLKVAVEPLGRDLLRNEAKVLENHEHPNVVRLIGHQEHRDRTVLELEWIDVEILRFPLSIKRLVDLMLGVASGLAALHQRGSVHCDVKPENILARKNDGRPLLIDFEASQPPGPRMSGYTPMFAAPEQVFGAHLDARADVYAFGMTLYLLFFYDRLPSILDPETLVQQKFAKILKAGVRRSDHYLAQTTMHSSGRRARAAALRAAIPEEKLPLGAASNESEILGAKYFFAAELERVADANVRLELAPEILAVIADSTENDPDKRPQDGAALVSRLTALAEALN